MRMLSLSIVVATLVLFTPGCSDSSAPTRSPGLTDYQLREYAQIVVTQALKSPSTAKFPSAEFEPNEYTIQKHDDRAYLITGWVDAQNSFGAVMRERWKLLMVPEFEKGVFVQGQNIYLEVGDFVAIDRREEYAWSKVPPPAE